jgi:hypothetical protein
VPGVSILSLHLRADTMEKAPVVCIEDLALICLLPPWLSVVTGMP